MAMKLVKKTEEYSIYLRGDQRYAVKDAEKQPINGDDKTRILVAEDLIKVALPAEKPAAEESAQADEGASEESSGEAAAADEPQAEAQDEAPAAEAAESGEEK